MHETVKPKIAVGLKGDDIYSPLEFNAARLYRFGTPIILKVSPEQLDKAYRTFESCFYVFSLCVEGSQIFESKRQAFHVLYQQALDESGFSTLTLIPITSPKLFEKLPYFDMYRNNPESDNLIQIELSGGLLSHFTPIKPKENKS